MNVVHIAIVTEVIQLPHSQQQACFINVEVWLVTLTDENTLALYIVEALQVQVK